MAFFVRPKSVGQKVCVCLRLSAANYNLITDQGLTPFTEVETMVTFGLGVAMGSDRIEKVEQDIHTLRNDLAELKREFQEFKKQLE